MDNQLILVIGNIEISWFAMFTSIACFIGMLIACILRRIQHNRISDIFVCVTFAVPLGLIFGRLLYILFSGSGLTGIIQFVDMTNGGFGLYGVFLGVFLASVIAAKLYNIDDLGRLLDCLSVGGAFAITVGRFATMFTSAEIGYEVKFKVLSVTDTEQNIYNLAVYNLDGIYEAIIFVLCLWFFIFCIKKCDNKKISGKTALLMLALHGTNQVVMDSMRADPLRLGLNEFIKISQILGIVCCVAVLIAFIAMNIKASGFHKFHAVSFLIIILAIILGVFGEYRVGSSNYISNHLIMFSGMVLLDWLALEFAIKTVEYSEPVKEVSKETVYAPTEESDEFPVKKQDVPKANITFSTNDNNITNYRMNPQMMNTESNNNEKKNESTQIQNMNMDSLMLELENIELDNLSNN